MATIDLQSPATVRPQWGNGNTELTGQIQRLLSNYNIILPNYTCENLKNTTLSNGTNALEALKNQLSGTFISESLIQQLTALAENPDKISQFISLLDPKVTSQPATESLSGNQRTSTPAIYGQSRQSLNITFVNPDQINSPQKMVHKLNAPLIESGVVKSPEMAAFLHTIGYFCEGAAVNRTFAGGTFDPEKGHPGKVVNSTHHGKKIASSAAGLFQIMKYTYESLEHDLLKAHPELTPKKGEKLKFTADIQEMMALMILKKCGVTEDIIKKNPEQAFAMVANIWASIDRGDGYSFYNIKGKNYKKYGGVPQPAIPMKKIISEYRSNLETYQLALQSNKPGNTNVADVPKPTAVPGSS